MSITLENTVRSVTLDMIEEYSEINKVSVEVAKIPGKSEPLHIDSDVKTVYPKEVLIVAYDSDVVRNNLLSLEEDREILVIDDGEEEFTGMLVELTKSLRVGAEPPNVVTVKLMRADGHCALEGYPYYYPIVWGC